MKIQETRSGSQHPVHPQQMGVVFVVVLFLTSDVCVGDDVVVGDVIVGRCEDGNYCLS